MGTQFFVQRVNCDMSVVDDWQQITCASHSVSVLKIRDYWGHCVGAHNAMSSNVLIRHCVHSLYWSSFPIQSRDKSHSDRMCTWRYALALNE